jgi:hypothetical protein
MRTVYFKANGVDPTEWRAELCPISLQPTGGRWVLYRCNSYSGQYYDAPFTGRNRRGWRTAAYLAQGYSSQSAGCAANVSRSIIIP